MAVDFGTATDYTVGTTPYSVASGDFNSDGKIDMVVANYDSNSVSLLLGNGSGGFGAATNFSVGTQPDFLVVADFNQDGRPDVATSNYSGGSGVSVLLGNGAGGFAAATSFVTGANPLSLAVGDLNGDSRPDLVTANNSSNNVSILIGNGAGGFGAATNFAVANIPYGVAIGDFNGDGKSDLVTANQSGSVSVLIGTGTGSFGAATNFSLSAGANGVVTKDFNLDGNLDIAAAVTGAGTVGILLGTGGGSFGSPTYYSVGANPNAVTAADFDLDGKLDLATANFGSSNVSVLSGTGTGTFGTAVSYAVGAQAISVAQADFNNDGKPDLATANFGASSATVRLNTTVPPGFFPVAQGVEFRVNTTTANNQYIETGSPSSHAIAKDSAGNFVVVWYSSGQDGSGFGVYGQRYNSAGVPQGSEFQINTTTANDQWFSALAMDSAGNFVVTWSSNLQDGSGYGIYARRFNSAGIPLTGEFLVNTTTASDQLFSDIAMDSAGNFVVTWSSNAQDGSSDGIYARRFSSAGAPLSGEFLVNTATTNQQTAPEIGMDAAGNFVITWTSYLQDGFDYGIYAQRFNSAGTPLGSEFQVATAAGSDQVYPSIAMNPSGNFVIAWDASNLDGSGYAVYARRYNNAGVAQGSEFRVNTFPVLDQRYSSVAIDTAGNFIIAWSSNGQDGSGYGIYAQAYSSVGLPLGNEFRVSTATSNAQLYPTMAIDGSGNLVVAWGSLSQDGSGYGIYAQRYSTTTGSLSATMSGGNLTVTDSSGVVNQLSISVSGGNYVVADTTEKFSSAPAGWTLAGDGKSISIPTGSFSGSITINGGLGNDTLTVNQSSGIGITSSGIIYNGGGGTDSLVVTGGGQGIVTYNYTNANDGNVQIDSDGAGGSPAKVITYTGLAPITNAGTASDVIFNLPAGGSVVTLGDDGTSGNGLSRLSSTPATFELTDFANPTGSITINRGNAADTLAVNALPDFNAGLTIGSAAARFSSVTFAGAITLGASKALSASAGTINVNAQTKTTGGSLSLSSSGNTNINAAVLSGGGNISIVPTSGDVVFAAAGLVDAESGSPTVTVGQSDTSLRFDGTDDYIQSGTALSASSGTWEAWVRKDNWAVHNDDRLLGNNIDFANNDSFYVSLHPAVGLHFRYGGTSQGGNNYASTLATQSLAANSWHHLAATWSHSAGFTTLTLFLDGVQVASNTAALLITLNPGMFLGGSPALPKFGPGNMDEVQVWNSARTPAQIAADMNQALTGSEAGLLAYYKLNEAEGLSAIDSKVGGNNGTIFGGATYAVPGMPFAGTNAVTMAAGSSINARGGALNVGANNAVSVQTLTTTGALNVVSAAGNVTTAAPVSAASAKLIAADMALGGSITATGSVTLLPTNGRQIDLGSNAAGKLGLTDSELDTITAGSILIGDSLSGAISVSAAISHTNANPITLAAAAGQNINLNAALTTAAGPITLGNNVVLAVNAALDTTNAGAVPAGAAITIPGTINLGSNTLSWNSGATNTSLANVITGTGGVLLKQGTGTLTLSGTNSYTGGTTLSQGTLIGSSNAAFGTGTITLGDAGTGSNNIAVRLANSADITNAVTVSASGTGTATIGTSGTGAVGNATTYSGLITLNRATTFDGTATDRLAIDGQVTGAVGTLTVSGGFRTTLQSTSNNFTGNIVITGTGTILQASVGSAGEVIPNAANVDVGTGAILQLAGAANSTETIGALTGTGTVTRNVSGTQTLVVGGGNATGTFSGVIQNGSGTVAIAKTGTGTEIFSTGNTYSGGTTISQGSLIVGNATGAGTGVVTLNDASTGTNATNFQANGAFTVANTINVSNNGTGISTIGTTTFNVGGVATIFSGNITLDKATTFFNGNADRTGYTGVISGAGAITITGPGVAGSDANRTNFDNNSNSFTGNISIAGTNTKLQLNNTNVIPDSVDIDVGSGNFLYFNTASETIDALTGGGAVQKHPSVAGLTTFTIGAGNTGGTFSGAIGNGGGTVALTKTGTGIQTLSGTSSYTGATNIDGGVILFNGSGATSTSSTININNGGTLRFGRNDTWGNHTTDTSSPVVVNAGGTLDSGAFFNTLRNPTLNGGTVILNGGVNGSFPALAFKGTVTVGGTQASQINVGVGSFNIISLGDDNLGATIFNVADATGNANADLIINAPLQNNAFGATGPVKSGAGTLSLTATNTYTGATVVSAGTLLVNGSIASSAVSVQSGATLGGTGTTGPLTIDAGATHSPGNSPGITTVTGNYVENGALISEIGTPSGSVAGTDYDQVKVIGSGSVTIGGTATLSVPYLGTAGTFNPGFAQVYTIIDNDGANPLDTTGIFTGFSAGTGITVDGKTLKIYYQGGDGNDVVLVSTNGTPTTLYVNDQFTATTVVDGDAEQAGFQGAYVGIDAFASISAALAAYPSFAGVIVVNGGSYASASLAGGGNVTLRLVQDLAEGINNVTIQGLSGDAGDTIVTRFYNLANANLIVDVGAAASYDGVISGTGGLSKLGAASLTLNGNNTYSGTTTVQVGVLEGVIGGAVATPTTPFGTSAITIDGGQLRFNRTAAMDSGLERKTVTATVNNNVSLTDYDNGGTTTFETQINVPTNATVQGNRWRGLLQVATAGSYTFRLNSDDGSVLYVDGVRVVNNEGGHGSQDRDSVAISLTSGFHSIEVQHSNGGGNGNVNLQYSGPDQATMGLIPAARFFRSTAIALANNVTVTSAGGTLDVAGNVPGLTLGALNIGAAGTTNFAVTAASGRQLNFASTNLQASSANVNLTVGGATNNGEALTLGRVQDFALTGITIDKLGGGRVVLDNNSAAATANDLNGTTLRISDGRLVNYASNVASTTIPIAGANIVINGGYLTLDSKVNAYTITNPITVQLSDATSGIEILPSNVTLTHNTGLVTINAGQTLIYTTYGGSANSIGSVYNEASQITGAGALTKANVQGNVQDGNTANTGFVRLQNNTNNYTGLTSVTGGSLIVAATNGLGDVSGDTTVANGAQLRVENTVAIPAGETITINGVGPGSGGALRNENQNNSIADKVILATASTIVSATANTTLTLTNGLDITNGAVTFDGNGNATLPATTGNITTTANLNGVTKNGTGTLTLAGTASNYGGVTSFGGGIVNVGSVADYGVNSSLGNRLAASEAATNIGLRFVGGTLQYTGSTAQSTNRQIRIGTSGGVIDASGSGAGTLSFTYSAANTDLYDTGGARTLTLTGSNTGANVFAIQLTDQAAVTGLTSLIKAGSGAWNLASNTSNFAGSTTVSAGTLRPTAANALGSTATGTNVDPGATLEPTGTFTLAAEPIRVLGVGANNVGALNANGNVTLSGKVSFIGSASIGATAGSTLNLNGGIAKERNSNVTFVGAGSINVNSSINDADYTLSPFTAKAYTAVNQAINDATVITNDFNGTTPANFTATLNGPLTFANAAGFNALWGSALADTFTTVFWATLTVNVGGTYSFAGTNNDDGAAVWIKPAANASFVAGDLLQGIVANNNTTSATRFLVPGQYTVLYAHREGTGAESFTGRLDGPELFSTSNATLLPIVNPANQTTTGTNNLIKSGTGTVSLNVANTYSGRTTVNSGTLIVAGATATLGNTAAGTFIESGATLGLQGGANISGEAITVNGTGAAGQLGAIVNLSGNNSIAATSSITAQDISSGEFRIASAAGQLTIDSPVNLRYSKLSTDGSGSIVVNGVISGVGATGTGVSPENTATNTNVFDFVPEANGYTLLYELGIPTTANFNATAPTYAVDNNVAFTAAFDRIAYYLELQSPGGSIQYVYASMNAFTANDALINIPNTAAKTFQQIVANMNVFSNVASIVTGTGIATGNIEFWMNDYSNPNGLPIPNASATAYDFGDTRSGGGNHGSMQIHNYDLDGAGAGTAGQTLFAYNNWGAGGTGGALGIGSRTTGEPDWTFAANVATYSLRNMSILVRETTPRTFTAANNFDKLGSGTVILTAANTYNGATTVNGGTLLANNTSGSATGTGNVAINNAAGLGGSGAVSGTVTGANTARLAPGGSPESLATGSVTLAATNFVDVEIFGTAPTTQYDQLFVSGAVNLNGAQLNLSGTLTPTPGALQSFTIIDNDGVDPVNGTFAGLAESAAVVFNGELLFITYQGGDGNDVVLSSQLVGTPGADTLVFTPISATSYQYKLNTNPTITITGSSSAFTFNGVGGDDTMEVIVNGNTFVTGGVFYNGEAQDGTLPMPVGDVLKINGVVANQTANYTPSATTMGSGTVATSGAGLVTFTGLEPVDMTGLVTATITLPGGADVLTISDGFDSVTGTIPAMRIDGTSGGVGIENVRLYNNTTVAINTTAVDAADTITISGITNAHANKNLTITTGAVNPDTVNIDGNIQLDGNFVLSGVENVVLRNATTITIDTELGNDNAGGAVDFGGAAVSSNAALRDFVINTNSTGFAGGAVTLGAFGNAGTFYVNDLTINTSGTTAGLLTLTGNIFLNNDGENADFVLTGNGKVAVSGNITVDTEQDTVLANPGAINWGTANIYGAVAGSQLALRADRASGAVGTSTSDISFGLVDNNAGAGFFLTSFTADTAFVGGSSARVNMAGDIFVDGNITIGRRPNPIKPVGSVQVIDSEQGNDGAGGVINLAGVMSTTLAGKDLLIDSSTGGAFVGGAVLLPDVAIDGSHGAFLNDLEIRTGGGSGAGSISLRGQNLLLNDNGAADPGSFTVTGGGLAILSSSMVIDTEDGSSAGVNGGSVNFGTSNLSSDATAGRDLTISVTNPNGTGGSITLNAFTNAGGQYLNDIVLGASGGAGGTITLNGSIQLTSNGAGAAANFTVNSGANIVLPNSITIDTQNSATLVATPGGVSLQSPVSASNPGVDLTIDTSNLFAGSPGGQVTLSTFNSAAGQLVNDLTINTASLAPTAFGVVTLNGAISLGTNGGDVGDFTISASQSIAANQAVTTTGNLSWIAQQGIALAATAVVNTGAGTVAMSANQDGAGAEGLTMAVGSSITTTNATAAAVSLVVNTGVGGTGSASLTSIQSGAAGTVTVNANGGSIADANGATVNITAGIAALNAATGIDLDTSVNSITATNTGAGNILIDEANAVTLTNVVATNGTITFTTAAVGDVTVENVNAGSQAVTMTIFDGDLVSGSGDANVADIVGGNVTLTITGANNNFGASAASRLELNAVTLRANVVTSGTNNAFILDTAGGLTMNDSTVTAGGTNTFDILVQNGSLLSTAGGPHDVGGMLVILEVTGAGSTIGTSATPLEVNSITRLDAKTGLGANDHIFITDINDFPVGLISAGAANVQLIAGGAMTDANGPGGNMIANRLVAVAANGIGTTVTPILISVNQLAAENTTSGDIFLINALLGTTTLQNFSPVTSPFAIRNSAPAGTVRIVTSAGGMVVAGNVSADSTVNLQAVETGAGIANLVVNSGVTIQSTNANVILNSGDTLTLSAGSITQASTTINLLTDTTAGDAEGGTITLGDENVLVAPGGTSLLGGNDAVATVGDTFNVFPQEQSALTIEGNDPTTTTGDTLVVNFTTLDSPPPTLIVGAPGSGGFSFTPGDEDPIFFQEIETVNTVGLSNYHLEINTTLPGASGDDGADPDNTPDTIVVRRNASGSDLVVERTGAAGANPGDFLGNIFQGQLSSILSLRVIGSSDDETLIVSDVNTLVDFAGVLPGTPLDNPLVAGPAAPDMYFQGGGGTDNLIFSLTQGATNQTIGFGNGLGGGFGQGEVYTTNGPRTLDLYFDGVAQATTTGTPGGALTTIADDADNTIAATDSPVVGRTRLSVTTGLNSHTPFDVPFGAFTSWSLQALGGNDAVRINDATNSLGIATTSVTLSGGTGTNSLTLEDVDDGTGDVINVNETTIVGLAAPSVTFGTFQTLDLTATGGADTITADFTTGGSALQVVNLRGNSGQDTILVPSRVLDLAELNLFGDDQIDTIGSATTRLAPSINTLIRVFGGDPVGPLPPNGNTAGDVLWLDMTGTQPLVVVDTVTGQALSASHQPVLFSQIETIHLYDDVNGVPNQPVPAVEMGDLFLRGSNNVENFQFLGNIRAGVTTTEFRYNNTFYGNFNPTRRIIVYGRSGDDRMTFDNFPNTGLAGVNFYGEDGNDYLAGASGNDFLFGGSGADTMQGLTGNDTIGIDPANPNDTGLGNDKIDGGEGDDTITGGEGIDSISGLGGNDLIWGGAGNDTITGGLGNDRIYGEAGADRITGEQGHDAIMGGADKDTLNGGLDNDLVIGGGGVDVVDGDEGDDLLIGGSLSWESTDAAIAAIMATWGNTSLTVAARRTALMTTGVGPGNTVKVDTTSVVNNDASIDSLYGDAGTDWFFAAQGTTGDKLLNSTGDTITYDNT